MLERTTRANLLYDFYGTLLSDKQKELFELYYHDDWSLGEIADKYQLTRQGVYDNIKRSEKALEEFEQKMGLYRLHLDKESIYTRMTEIIVSSSLSDEHRQEMQQLLEKLQMND